jgi:heat shock protein HslJ
MKNIHKIVLAGLSLLLITITMGVAGCSGTQESTGLEGVRWVLKSYGTPGSLTPVLPDKEVWLEFKRADKTVSGNAGVNLISGRYNLDENKLTMDSFMMTLMAGPEPLMSQETAYVKILGSVQSFKIEGQTLTLTGTEGTLVFTQK